MRPTAERLAIYVKMLEILNRGTLTYILNKIEVITHNGANYPIYLCMILDMLNSRNVNIADYPELYAQKPSHIGALNRWWNPDEEGRLKRIKVLQKAIEQCQQKLSAGV